MLQFPKYGPPAVRDHYADLLATYQRDNDENRLITADQQESLLQRLDEEIHLERIYFSVSLAENRIIHCNGVSRWLGYADAEFSLRDYLEIIHPTHASLQCYYSAALLELLTQNKVALQFMRPVCASLIALKHKSGRYIYCKRECSPFQLTEANEMTEYLCQFYITKSFHNEPYHTRLCPINGQDAQRDAKLVSPVQKKFAEYTDFSMQELRILKRYAYQKNSTSELIGKAFKIKKSTVDTFNKRILKKAETFSKQRFNTAKEAALYFKNAGLV